jgi:hypothetical protein
MTIQNLRRAASAKNASVTLAERDGETVARVLPPDGMVWGGDGPPLPYLEASWHGLADKPTNRGDYAKQLSDLIAQIDAYHLTCAE